MHTAKFQETKNRYQIMNTYMSLALYFTDVININKLNISIRFSSIAMRNRDSVISYRDAQPNDHRCHAKYVLAE